MTEKKTVLETELATYEANRERLLGEAEGRWVLIHGEEIVGTYDTQHDAINEGFRHFGHVPFLTKKIVVVEIPWRFASPIVGG